MKKILLAAGIAAPLLYAAMNLVIPWQWKEYHAAAQAISELSAIGAPTRPLWVVFGTLYALLIAGFGIGIWQSAQGNRRLRVAGAALLANGLLCLFWPPMHPRGTVFTLTDTLHIGWTGVTIALMLIAMGFAAGAFGRRFRIYTIASMVLSIGFGTLTGLDAPRVAAGLPTPWMGVWERISAAASLLWVLGFAVTLLRNRTPRVQRSQAVAAAPIHGFVAPGFEAVRTAFERNFAERGEIGAAVAAYWRGEKVVDLWGGYRTPARDAPWEEHTMVGVASTTKGLAAMTLALAHSRGWLEYDAPVARYWPEFAQNGKADITVRQLLSHQAGLVLLDQPITVDLLRDLDAMARILARQRPAWPPGTRHGYHTVTLGLYMQELIRRVDPAHRSLGRFFRDEIAAPLGLEFHIGLPAEVPPDRIARVMTLSPWRGLLALRYTPPAVTLKMIRPGSLLRRSFLGLSADPNDRSWLAVEVPAGSGVGTARAIARAYSAFAEGGAELGITRETFAQLVAPPPDRVSPDAVLGVPSCFSLGFLKPGPQVSFGSSPRAFGAPGAGGSFGFADPDARLGYAYVMNKLDFYLENDPREKALRDAVYRAIARQSVRVRAETPAGVGPA
jgi:CubicO group peptidase (beta-lactamase class C family)